MSVNAEEGLVIFIFIDVSSCVVLRVFFVAAIDLNRRGGSGEPPPTVFVLRGFGFLWFHLRTRLRRTCVLGFWVSVGSQDFGLRVGAFIAVFTGKVNNYL